MLLLLAAGQSSRMGLPKALIDWKGKPLFIRHLESFAAFGGAFAVIVASKENKKNLNDALNQYPVNLPTRVSVNPDPEREMLSSIKVGLNSAKTPESVFLLPVDTPVFDQQVWQALSEGDFKGEKVRIPSHAMKSGHPLLLSPQFVKDLCAVSSDQRLDHLIGRLTIAEKRFVNVNDPSVLGNWNTPKDVFFP